MILLIDNYDSFTYNLAHLVGEVCGDIEIHRNDQISVDDALLLNPDAIVLSPGPRTPDQAGICVPLVKAAIKAGVPLLGVCLGHQAIAEATGAKIVRAGQLMHGKTSSIEHDGSAMFRNIPSPFTATRYHSLSIDKESLTDDVRIIATAMNDQEIMAIQIRNEPIFGVQFHPESVLSEFGVQLVENFLESTKQGQSAA